MDKMALGLITLLEHNLQRAQKSWNALFSFVLFLLSLFFIDKILNLE